MSLAHTVVINAPSNQRGRPTPICRMSIKLSSVAANEDYRRQSQVRGGGLECIGCGLVLSTRRNLSSCTCRSCQVLSTDARDELYGASDEDVDMDGCGVVLHKGGEVRHANQLTFSLAQ